MGRVGHGQWAGVYRARPANASPDRPAAYAVKMLHESRRHDSMAIEMLAREAEVCRRVSHPHLIAVLESQLHRNPQFLVMPWLEGSTLEAYFRTGQSLDPAAVLWIARQTAEAMAAVDEAGWMHADIKPSNIYLSPLGHVTLLDLGFARRHDGSARRHDGFARRHDESVASHSAIRGTPWYLAPEYVSSSHKIDVRSDIYSLGVVLYQMLAGRLPFHGKTMEQLAMAHKQTAPPMLRGIVPQISPRAAGLVHRMLAKDPLRRPQSPGELVTELVRLEIEAFSERAA